MTDLEHRTVPLATRTTHPVEAGAPGTAPLLQRLELLLAWVGDGCGVPGSGPNGALAIATSAPLVGGSAVTALGHPRTHLADEPLLDRAWRTLVDVRFVLPRRTRARTSAAGRRWLAATGADRDRGDVALLRAYVVGVLEEPRPRRQPGWPLEDVALTDDPGDLRAAAPPGVIWEPDPRWDEPRDGEPFVEPEDGRRVSGSDDDCGCLPCQVTREEARRRVERRVRLDLAAVLAQLCRGGELSAEDPEPPGADDVLPRSRLDVAGELRLLRRAGLLQQRSAGGPVHLEDRLVPAVRSGLRRWARTTATRPPL